MHLTISIFSVRVHLCVSLKVLFLVKSLINIVELNSRNLLYVARPIACVLNFET